MVRPMSDGGRPLDEIVMEIFAKETRRIVLDVTSTGNNYMYAYTKEYYVEPGGLTLSWEGPDEDLALRIKINMGDTK